MTGKITERVLYRIGTKFTQFIGAAVAPNGFVKIQMFASDRDLYEITMTKECFQALSQAALEVDPNEDAILTEVLECSEVNVNSDPEGSTVLNVFIVSSVSISLAGIFGAAGPDRSDFNGSSQTDTTVVRSTISASRQSPATTKLFPTIAPELFMLQEQNSRPEKPRYAGACVAEL